MFREGFVRVRFLVSLLPHVVVNVHFIRGDKPRVVAGDSGWFLEGLLDLYLFGRSGVRLESRIKGTLRSFT